MEFEGEPLVRRVTRRALAARLGNVCATYLHNMEGVAKALEGLDVQHVRMPPMVDPRLSDAFRAALAVLPPEADAVMFIPSDIPLISTELFDQLIGAYEATGGAIVAPTYRGRRWSPMIFDRSLFPELEALEGDKGGKSLFRRYFKDIVEVPVKDGWTLADIDTPKAYQHLLNRHSWSGRARTAVRDMAWLVATPWRRLGLRLQGPR